MESHWKTTKSYEEPHKPYKFSQIVFLGFPTFTCESKVLVSPPPKQIRW